MTDFAKLEAMVDSALPFVKDWASDEHRRAHLEICLAGCSAVARHLASRFHWTFFPFCASVALARSSHLKVSLDVDRRPLFLAAKTLITQDEAQSDLAPSGWIPDRTHPCSVVTFTL